MDTTIESSNWQSNTTEIVELVTNDTDHQCKKKGDTKHKKLEIEKLEIINSTKNEKNKQKMGKKVPTYEMYLRFHS